MTRQKGRQPDPLELRARELCALDGLDPDSRIAKEGSTRGQPAWCAYRQAARAEQTRKEQEALRISNNYIATNDGSAPLMIFGAHEPGTVAQMTNCMRFGDVHSGVIAADGHLGYAQPVGGVIAYRNAVSVSGVGFDIACGNAAVRLDVPYATIEHRIPTIARDIAKTISFGAGQTNIERVEHELFDDDDAWRMSGREDYRQKARAQLGTVGGGNHYVDVFVDDHGFVWIGVHFGSRGLGHSTATKYLKLAGGKEGINVPPTILDVSSDLGRGYIAAMELAGRYAYAGRDWVVERVRKIIGGAVTDSVHNHHNFAWYETHGDESLWVVRKGATPAFPDQRGFVGGSMGDDAVILAGIDSPRSKESLYSTVHGAGRLFGRKEAKRRFTHEQWRGWMSRRKPQTVYIGGDLDESPMAYRRLSEVVSAHQGTVRIQHVLHPVIVVMAGEGEKDPFRD